jgi:hypothetical protein
MTDMMPDYERPTYDEVWKMFQETGDTMKIEIPEGFRPKEW